MRKLIIFDMDGLMLDTEQLYFRAYTEVCLAHGLEAHRSTFLQMVGADDAAERAFYNEVYPQLGIGGFHAALQARRDALVDAGAYDVKPGLFDLFSAIEGLGIPKAVVTANGQQAAVKMLAHCGILPHLDGGVYREMVARGKPAPDAHLLCCSRFAVAPKDALVLEDSETGLQASLAAGIPTIAVPDLMGPSKEVLSQCFARCDRLLDVIPFL